MCGYQPQFCQGCQANQHAGPSEPGFCRQVTPGSRSSVPQQLKDLASICYRHSSTSYSRPHGKTWGLFIIFIKTIDAYPTKG